MEWTVEALNETVSKELEQLPTDIRARFVRICELVGIAGPGNRPGLTTRQRSIEMIKVSSLHKKWSRDPDYQDAYNELGPEFELARMLVEARTRAGLTQTQLAARMKTKQSVIARLEGGRVHPSIRTLQKIAQATGTRLRISFD